MTAQVFSVAEVAELLDCAETTVRERAPELGGLKFGRDWRFPAGALARRLDDLALAAAAAHRKPKAGRTAVLHPVPAGKARRRPPALPQLDGAQ